GLCRECEARLMQLRGCAASAGGMDEEVAVVAQVESGSDRRAGTDAPGGTVLVADDDPVNREVLRRLLSQQGHSVAEAADGGEALRLLEQRGFDVLLLDILMPGLDGFRVLRRMREEGRLRRTSVIVVSALDEIHNVVHC